MNSIFASNYLPCVQYMSHYIIKNYAGKSCTNTNSSYIDATQIYTKQSYSNRCQIAGANGTMNLIIPVVKGRGSKTRLQNIEIAYYERWQHLHWQSIISAYKSSPFFEYYMDYFEPFYKTEFKFLLDFNTKLFKVILECLELDSNTNTINKRSELESISIAESNDYRAKIHPKISIDTDESFKPLTYHQVFEAKHGFTSNLSIIDLIFNKGPEAYDILCDSIVQH